VVFEQKWPLGNESRTLVHECDDPAIVALAKYKIVCHSELRGTSSRTA